MIIEPKTVNSKRIVPIPDFFKAYIREYYYLYTNHSKDNYILTNSNKVPDPRTLQNQFLKVCELYDFKINFHALRHTYATHCVMSDVDIKSLSEILGHSNISTTLNLYVHSSLEFKKNQVNKIAPPKFS